MNIFILKGLPKGRNTEAIKLDVGAGNQWLGEIDLDNNSSIPPLSEELYTLINGDQSVSLGDDKFQSNPSPKQ